MIKDESLSEDKLDLFQDMKSIVAKQKKNDPKQDISQSQATVIGKKREKKADSKKQEKLTKPKQS